MDARDALAQAALRDMMAAKQVSLEDALLLVQLTELLDLDESATRREILCRVEQLQAEVEALQTERRSLNEAKELVRANLEEGIECPCCGQWSKLYPRKLYSDMAAFLVWLVRRHTELKASLAAQDFEQAVKEMLGDAGLEDGTWVRVTDFPLRGGDYGKLAHWGLCELKPKDPMDKNKRTSGLWRPTEKGAAFVRGEITVPSHVMLFDSQIYGWSEEVVSIRAVLGESFDYDELMTGNINGALAKAKAKKLERRRK